MTNSLSKSLPANPGPPSESQSGRSVPSDALFEAKPPSQGRPAERTPTQVPAVPKVAMIAAMLEQLDIIDGAAISELVGRRSTTQATASELAPFVNDAATNVTHRRDRLLVEWSQMTEGSVCVCRVGPDEYFLNFHLDDLGR